VITTQQQRVRERFPDTPLAELVLLPSPHANPTGVKSLSGGLLDLRHRDWVDQLPVLRHADGTEFDRAKIVPYAYRHTYAQRHADAGIAVDVLSQLLDHRTRGHPPLLPGREQRRRAAVDTVTAHSFDRHGHRLWRDAHAPLDSEHARYAVGDVAVPYGRGTEPSNGQAGGGACPVRFRCAGCDHFRTDVSHLPELTAYLDDLLRTRERLAATLHGIDEWARADATPSTEEITRIRRLINRINGDIAGLDAIERAHIDDAVAVLRRHRAAHPVAVHTVPLGLPTIRATAPAPTTAPRPRRPEATANTRTVTNNHTDTPTAAPSRRAQLMLDGRHADGARRRQRVLAALDRRTADGAQISVSAIARAAGVDRSFLYRHRDLLEKIHALAAEPPATSAERAGPTVSLAPLPADQLAAHERAARLHSRVQHLERRLSDALGERAWHASGLGATADIDALHQQITRLEQQIIDLSLQLAERDEDLAAARATNREFMARINASHPTR
jgi:hypothetical protein